MHYIYIIRSLRITNQLFLYIGYTTDIARRFEEHNAGRSFHTKKYMPWQLVYSEGYANEEDARHREKTLKQFGKVYSQLKRRIRRSLQGVAKVRG